MILPPQALLAATLVLIVGGALQGSVGYGMALLASPLLVLIDPRLVPAPFLLAAMVMNILVTLREGGDLDRRGLLWLSLGMVPGTALGAAVLASLPEHAMSIGFGVITVVAVGMSLLGLRFAPQPPVLTGAGFVSGLMNVITGLSGPPVALVYQDASPRRLRATLSSYFIAGALVSFVALALAGHMGLRELQLSLVLLPGVILGYLISGRLVGLIRDGSLRYIILAMSGISGLVVIAKQLITH